MVNMVVRASDRGFRRSPRPGALLFLALVFSAAAILLGILGARTRALGSPRTALAVSASSAVRWHKQPEDLAPPQAAASGWLDQGQDRYDNALPSVASRQTALASSNDELPHRCPRRIAGEQSSLSHVRTFWRNADFHPQLQTSRSLGASSAPSSPPGSRGNAESQPTPQCSVLLFFHIQKAAGTTVRAMLQRQAQLGRLDLVSYAKMDGSDHVWLPTLYKLQLAAEAARRGDVNALQGLRLAVELHGGGRSDRPAALLDVLIDVRAARRALEDAGCRVVAATVLREPLPHALSWFDHFFKAHVPLCQWAPQPSLQARTLLGVTREADWPHLAPPDGTPLGRAYLRWMLGELDVIGTVERFDESLLAIARMAGIREPSYVAVNVRGDDSSAQSTARFDEKDQRSKLLARAISLQANSAGRVLKQLEKGSMPRVNCAYIGCGETLSAAEGHYTRQMCAATNESLAREAAAAVLAGGATQRTASPAATALIAEAEATLVHVERTTEVDARVYREASAHLDGVLARLAAESGGRWSLASELEAMSVRNAALAEELKAQTSVARERGGVCARFPTGMACQGPDPFCTGCEEGPSEPDRMSGCWPDHPWKFMPRERHSTCARRWAGGINASAAKLIPAAKHATKRIEAVVPCWNACWRRVGDGAAEQCAGPPCPSERPTLAQLWHATKEGRTEADGEREAKVLAAAEASASEALFPGVSMATMAVPSSSVIATPIESPSAPAGTTRQTATASSATHAAAPSLSLNAPQDSAPAWLAMAADPSTALGRERAIYKKWCSATDAVVATQTALHASYDAGNGQALVMDWSSRLLWNGIGNEIGHAANLLGICADQEHRACFLDAGNRGDNFGLYLSGPGALDWLWTGEEDDGAADAEVALVITFTSGMYVSLHEGHHAQVIERLQASGLMKAGFADILSVGVRRKGRLRESLLSPDRAFFPLMQSERLMGRQLLALVGEHLGADFLAEVRVLRVYLVHDAFADFSKQIKKQKNERGDKRRNELIGGCFRTALFQAKPALQEAILSILERLEGASKGAAEGWMSLHARTGYVDATAHWRRPSLEQVPRPAPAPAAFEGFLYDLKSLDTVIARESAAKGVLRASEMPAACGGGREGGVTVTAFVDCALAVASTHSVAAGGDGVTTTAFFLSADAPIMFPAVRAALPAGFVLVSVEGDRGHSSFNANWQQHGDMVRAGGASVPRTTMLAMADWFLFSLAGRGVTMMGTSFTKSATMRSVSFVHSPLKATAHSVFSHDSFTKRHVLKTLRGNPCNLTEAARIFDALGGLGASAATQNWEGGACPPSEHPAYN